MPDGVLPPSSVQPVIWEVLHNVFVNFGQCHLLFWRALDSHGYKSNVGIGRSLVDLHSIRNSSCKQIQASLVASVQCRYECRPHWCHCNIRKRVRFLKRHHLATLQFLRSLRRIRLFSSYLALCFIADAHVMDLFQWMLPN